MKKNLFSRQLGKMGSKCWAIILALIATLIIVLVLWLIGQLCGYKVDLIRSLQEKVLKRVVVLNMPPKTRIFTVYGTEFGLSTSGETEYIKDKDILKVKKRQRLFLGVWNDEGVNLHNLACIIILPEGIKVIKEEEMFSPSGPWIEMFINKQYEYVYRKSLGPRRGRMFHPTLELEFLEEKEYPFKYVVLCDDFLPKEGSLIFKVE